MRQECLLWSRASFSPGEAREMQLFFSEERKWVGGERGGLEVKICVTVFYAEMAKTAVALPPARCFSLCPLLVWWAAWWMHCTVLSKLAFFPPATAVSFSVNICTLHILRHLIMTTDTSTSKIHSIKPVQSICCSAGMKNTSFSLSIHQLGRTPHALVSNSLISGSAFTSPRETAVPQMWNKYSSHSFLHPSTREIYLQQCVAQWS